MSDNNIATAIAYYDAYNKKDIVSITRYSHPDIHFIAPMGESNGRDSVLEAVKRFLTVIKKIEIREKFSFNDQVMLVYDLIYGESSALCRTAVLMNFKENLITRLELFYDVRPFGNL